MTDLSQQARELLAAELPPAAARVLQCGHAVDITEKQALRAIEAALRTSAGYIEQHARDSAELRRLCAERDAHRDTANRLRHAGSLLSNIAYNLAQDEKLSETTRWSLDDARKKWDAAIAQREGS